jgi:hypothetical protein
VDSVAVPDYRLTTTTTDKPNNPPPIVWRPEKSLRRMELKQAVSRSRNGLVVVALAMSTLVADGYDLIVYGLAVPELLNEPGWELSKHGAGYTGSLTMIGMSMGLFVAGPMTDRIGRRNLMMIGVA